MKSVNIALDILQTAIISIVEWLSNAIPWGGPSNALTVLLILLLGFSSISSIIRIFLFKKSHGLDLKAERKLQEKFEVMREYAPYVSREAYAQGIATRVSVVYFLRSIFDSASKIVKPFGAYFLTTRKANPTRIFTVGNIALSLGIMFIGWLSHDERKELVDRVSGIYSDVAEWVLSPKSIFGLLVLVFSIWTFAGRTPIIDHVRARSEASAKANSMLLRVSASVYDLYLKVARRNLGFDAEMDRINDEVIREVSGGRYEWFAKEIRAASSYRVQNEVNDSAFGELEDAVDSLNVELEELRAEGIDLVAARLSGRASDHLEYADIGLSRTRLTAAYLLKNYWPVELLRKRCVNALPWYWAGSTSYEKMLSDEEINRDLVESSRKIRNNSIDALFDIRLKERHLYAAANLLERRKSGTFLIRALSARYGK